MRIEKVFLNKENKDVYLEAYIADKLDKFERKAMLVMGKGCLCRSRLCADRHTTVCCVCWF